jgi:predicted DNA-binding protein (UPF0251 family)
MAVFIGMGKNKYGEIERGMIPNKETLDEFSWSVEGVEPNRIELLRILRIRQGWSQKECAEQAGVSRFWFNRMEMEAVSCDKLKKFWGLT